MNDFISAVSSLLLEFLPYIWPLLGFFFVSFSIFNLLRLIDPSYSFSLFDWLKNKFIDLLKLFVPFPVLYKLGLARLGIDYVECETQLCSDCPFLSTCNHPKEEVSSNEA